MGKQIESVLPREIADEAQLEELLSRPDERTIELFKRLEGDLLILGGAGKIGPSLVGLACRARQAAGGKQTIYVVDRPGALGEVGKLGAKPISADLFDPAAVAALPRAPNVIYMVGQKFGTSDNPALTWAANAIIPIHIARHFAGSRIVVYSTGCVYPLAPADSAGSVETAALEPIGEYSNACVARERLFQYFSAADKTPMVLVRLNYAVEMRYGVLVDLASQVLAGQEVDLAMGYFNVIWQGDCIAMALALLEHAAVPAMPINLTGPEKLSVRQVAERLGELTGKSVRFRGQEALTALLSDASKACALLGPPRVQAEQVIAWTARWLTGGGKTLGKPTHFQSRDGKY